MVIGLLTLSGCAKLSHMDQLLTLKGLADEQSQMKKYVQEQDRKFDLMLNEVKAGTLDDYSNERKVLRTFGEPVFKEHVSEDGQELELWLYRYATEFFGSDKVYLYFDKDGNLVKSEYIEGKNGESEQETTQEDGRQEA